MALYEFWTSRNNSVANTAAYVGKIGRLFYDNIDGILKISDGVTPGGIKITYPIATTSATGGIKAGPGANVSIDGTLTIDTTGLPLSIGNLQIIDTQIKTTQANVDMYMVANGTGNVNLIGEVNFYKPNGFPPTSEPFFRAKSDGQIRMLVPAEDPVEGAVEIIGSASGNYIAPGQAGAMLQITGNPATPARVYVDGNAEYVSLVARRFNGNVAVPTQVLANQDVFRINGTAATTSGVGNVALAQIRMTALENQTPTAQGSSITFTVTPIGSSASSRVDVANVTVAYGLGATKATIQGNITAGNLTVSGTMTGVHTHNVRNAGAVTGTLTLNYATDDIVRCTFSDNITVAHANLAVGKVVTLIATNSSGGDTDVVTSGVAATNVTDNDATFTVTQGRVAIIRYYSVGTTTDDLFVNPSYS